MLTADPIESFLEVYTLATRTRQVVYRSPRHFEAPNWSRDGSHFIINSAGRIFTVATSGGDAVPIASGTAVRCNNDHGLSPDGKWLAVSHEPAGKSLIYVLPSGGGEPRLVTANGPSYWHGWSPDGTTLAYCAERDGRFGIFTIPLEGGAERRVTTAVGLDDGPDYAPDGSAIFFNSDRTGIMRIWRVAPDGGDLQQVTFDEAYADWFPHPSPDGKCWCSFPTIAPSRATRPTGTWFSG